MTTIILICLFFYFIAGVVFCYYLLKKEKHQREKEFLWKVMHEAEMAVFEETNDKNTSI